MPDPDDPQSSSADPRDLWCQDLGVPQESFDQSSATTAEPDASTGAASGQDSDDFRQGYQDGLSGGDANPIPRDGSALAEYEDGYAKGHYELTHNAPSTGPAPSSPLQPTDAKPEEQPQSLQVGGLPAFRYNLPNIPMATAQIETPEASFQITLALRGSVTVTFPNAPPNVSTDLDTGGWRLQATQALGPLTTGLRVNGIGTPSPSIGVTLGTKYETTEYRFVPPNTMVFIGQASVNYTVPSQTLGKVAVQGQVGFEMRITAIPHPGAREDSPVSESEENWFQEYAPALVAVGAVALIAAIAIAAAPETGGASLVLLGAT